MSRGRPYRNRAMPGSEMQSYVHIAHHVNKINPIRREMQIHKCDERQNAHTQNGDRWKQNRVIYARISCEYLEIVSRDQISEY